MNLNDPTGHCGEGSVPSEGVGQGQHDWLCTLREKALEISLQVNKGEVANDVEALAQIVEFAAPHYIQRGRGGGTENRSAMANDLGIVIGGNEFRPVEGIQEVVWQTHGGFFDFIGDTIRDGLNLGEFAASTTNRCNNSNYSPDDMCQYYTGAPAFKSRGFKEEFAEGDGNQVAHFGGGMSALGNMGEIGLNTALDRENNPPDKSLYIATLKLWQSNTRIAGWGNWIRSNLMDME